MASSRKPKRAERPASDLLPTLRAAVAGLIPSGSRILVALSGGIDSVALLDTLRRLAARRRWQLSALHVNHQLQAGASEWAAFCRRMCREAGIPLRTVKVVVPSGNSLEDAARKARYEVFVRQPVDFIALAHNQDDQVETVLLHLLRGAGIRGLAGMRVVSAAPVAQKISGSPAPQLLRPLLAVPRTAIAEYARARKLVWVDDPSNESSVYSRNFLRNEVLPQVGRRMPAYRAALSRAAAHAAEAAHLLDELAALDGSPAGGQGVALSRLRALPPARAKNLLRHFLQCQGIEIPSAERLEEALRQARAARPDARVAIELGRQTLRLHKGVLVVAQKRPPPPAEVVCRLWQGEAELHLPELGGVLRMEHGKAGGISLTRLAQAPVTVSMRKGGERLRLSAGGRSRTVKNLMQEAGMASWARERLPFIFCGDALVCVPGIGIAAAYQAAPGEPGVLPVWESD